ncbi:MAG: NAD-dependent epimerase/dehydratase family protein [Pseudomonadota bacterium]
MSVKKTRTALIGAGYIATWHADAIRTTGTSDLTAVCDVSQSAAEAMAEGLGVEAYTSLDDLIAADVCDAVHILTPPHTHRDIAVDALKGGLHVLIEKPFAETQQECNDINTAAVDANKIAAVSHNFLAVPSYLRLKNAIANGDLGRVTSAEINWHFPLAPLRSGPFGLWMLRQPENILLELGPHLYAFAHDLFGQPENWQLTVGKPINVPSVGTHYQSWRILANAGAVDISINLQLVETVDDRSVTVRGSSGLAKLDYASDTLVLQKENASDIVINPLRRETSATLQHLREGVVNATRQVKSLNRESPYGLSFQGTVRAFYEAIQQDKPIAPQFSGISAEAVIGSIEDTLKELPERPVTAAASRAATPVNGSLKPTVLVIGGTGFLGRHLTKSLVKAGHQVRVLSRGKSQLFDEYAHSIETVSASMHDAEGMRRAMEGIKTVYHLARALENTWEDCLKNDVGTTELIAEAAIDAGVERFIYTGTIASYDMSSPTAEINEDTVFADDMSDRNLYARSKAECEKRLMKMYEVRGLPLVIARPGIVVGHGGPLQHWGIGRWHGAGAVRIWGHGNNVLPFVLIDDVSDALIKMMEIDEAIGQSFNIVGEPMLSARDYFKAIHDKIGARISVSSGSLVGFFASDAVKYSLKRYVLRKCGVNRPSLRDWKSRAHFSPFNNAHPKKVLGWQPEADREAFLRKAIVDANLMGF